MYDQSVASKLPLAAYLLCVWLRTLSARSFHSLFFLSVVVKEKGIDDNVLCAVYGIQQSTRNLCETMMIINYILHFILAMKRFSLDFMCMTRGVQFKFPFVFFLKLTGPVALAYRFRSKPWIKLESMGNNMRCNKIYYNATNTVENSNLATTRAY